MVSYKDKIVTFPLFNTCYPQNLARNLARFKPDLYRFPIHHVFKEIDDWNGICGHGSPENCKFVA